jgi:hypothetical protein
MGRQSLLLVSSSWRMISLFAKSFAKMSEIRQLP